MHTAPEELPTILIFATGGTIGMRETSSGLAPDPDFPEVLEELAGAIAAPLGIQVRINHLQPAIDSANADAETAPKIARAIRARVGAMRPRGVVVTHGTDTLAYTASRLAFELSDLGTPVVLTGSQLAHGAANTDAADNLRLAIRVAAKAGRQAPVTVAFGGAILPAVRATKSDAEAFEAFRAERTLDPNTAGVPPIRPEADGREPARVLSYRFTPGVTPADLTAAVGADPDALVLECYGAGNAPTSRHGMRDAIRAIADRMPVVAITQCAQGTAQLGRYAVGSELATAGVIDGGDLTIEAAIAKLGYLLDAGYAADEVKTLMPVNLAGEMSASA
ncbi:asparaginase [Leucobacter sp. 1207-22]|uniref:asparaginase n=1 Tax=Leucobacter sp. 1207-22 TaxID=2604456 RepID=UPI004063639E